MYVGGGRTYIRIGGNSSTYIRSAHAWAEHTSIVYEHYAHRWYVMYEHYTYEHCTYVNYARIMHAHHAWSYQKNTPYGAIFSHPTSPYGAYWAYDELCSSKKYPLWGYFWRLFWAPPVFSGLFLGLLDVFQFIFGIRDEFSSQFMIVGRQFFDQIVLFSYIFEGYPGFLGYSWLKICFSSIFLASNWIFLRLFVISGCNFMDDARPWIIKFRPIQA